MWSSEALRTINAFSQALLQWPASAHNSPTLWTPSGLPVRACRASWVKYTITSYKQQKSALFTDEWLLRSALGLTHEAR